MHIGKNNGRHKYQLSSGGASFDLKTTRAEKDLGIQLTDNLKWHAQSVYASNKANFVTSSLKRAFSSRSTRVWKMLYTTYIRPHVEFAAAAWSPYEKRDIKLLERVQRKATKIPTATAQLDYEDRCAALGLTSLEARRTRGDLLTR